MSTSYKILGQLYFGPLSYSSNNGYGYYGGGEGVEETLEPKVLYTVPNGKQAIISSLFATNHDSISRTYDIAVVPDGETLALRHHIKWDTSITPNGFNICSLKIAMSAGDKIMVMPSTADKFSFSVFGLEL